VNAASKRALLSHLLADETLERVIVFTRTKRGANRVAEALEDRGVRSEAIHGNKSQNARQKALDNFSRGRARVLVATDLASRGIDVTGVTHVINYELPADAESYVHRIGRTARAGASGIALSFCDGSERGQLKSIERLTNQRIAVVSTPANEDLPQRPAPAPQRRDGHDRSAERDGSRHSHRGPSRRPPENRGRDQRGERHDERSHRPHGDRPHDRHLTRPHDQNDFGDYRDRPPEQPSDGRSVGQQRRPHWKRRRRRAA
jgi:ATP-dependent RNA helicase RhlE